MSKKYLIGFLYVSIFVVIWGTIGSLVDYPLLQNNIYQAGSFGQLTTFIATGTSTTILAIILFKKFLKNYLE